MKLESICQELKLVEIVPAQHVGAITGDYIDCKGFQKAFIIVMCGYVSGTDSLLTLREAKTAIGGGVVATTKYPRIFVNLDTATSDTLAEVTAAATYILNLDQEATNHMVVFEWDCVKFSEGFYYLNLLVGAGSASNFISALFVGVPRYTPAADITALV